MSPVSRRTLTKGAAWSVPAVALAAAAPAAALSCPATVTEEIAKYFTDFKAQLPDLTGARFVLSYHVSNSLNGAGLGNASVHLTNEGTVNLDASTFPFSVDLAFRNVGTSPAINNTFRNAVRTDGMLLSESINLPWDPRGGNEKASETVSPENYDTWVGPTAKVVGQCSSDTSTVPKRRASLSSSYLKFYDPVTGRSVGAGYLAGNFAGTRCFPDNSGAYGWSTRVNTTIKAGAYVNIAAITLEDGTSSGRTIFAALGARVHGFFPPTWEDFLQAKKNDADNSLTEDEITTCYADAYQARVELWNSSGEGLMGAETAIAGWSLYYTGYDATADISGWYRGTVPNEWTWSNEVGQFAAVGTENDDLRVTAPVWTPTKVQAATYPQALVHLYWRDGIM